MQPRRGRVRSESTRRAILEATRDELAASGYDKLSIDRIAAAAGAGKQTVYRWYPTKSALVADCLLEGYVLPATSIGVPDTGDIRRDLGDWLRAFAEGLDHPQNAALIRACTAAAADNDEVAAKFYENATAATETALTERLHAAELAGQLKKDAPAVAVAEALIGAMLFQLLTRQRATVAFTEGLTEAVLAGIALTPSPAQR